MNKHHWKPWLNEQTAVRRWHLSVPGSGRDGRGRALACCGALAGKMLWNLDEVGSFHGKSW